MSNEKAQSDDRRKKLESFDDAVAITLREGDNFYPTAFLFECWIGEMICRTVAEYAEKKDARERVLQRGMAEERFARVFGHVTDGEFPHLFRALLRFSEYDDVLSEHVFRALRAMSVELPAKARPPVKGARTAAEVAESVGFLRSFVRRLGEWLEALLHAETHELAHRAPVAFDQDPERRELAILGVNQRHFVDMGPSAKAWWEWHHSEAAKELGNSPKWPMIGKGMLDDKPLIHRHPVLDELVILLWPLVRRHGWTYVELIRIIEDLAPPSLGKPDEGAYPWESEQKLSTYCRNVLGLRKGSSGRSAKGGLPVGAEVARTLFGRAWESGQGNSGPLKRNPVPLRRLALQVAGSFPRKEFRQYVSIELVMARVGPLPRREPLRGAP